MSSLFEFGDTLCSRVAGDDMWTQRVLEMDFLRRVAYGLVSSEAPGWQCLHLGMASWNRLGVVPFLDDRSPVELV